MKNPIIFRNIKTAPEFPTLRLQDKYNSDKTWVIQSRNGRLYLNQDFNGIKQAEKWSAHSVKHIAQVTSRSGLEIQSRMKLAVNIFESTQT